MELIVVDASVAAKLILSETQTSVAEELFRGHQRCTAPAIIKLEVTGAVLRRFRLGAMSREDAQAACDDWHSLIDDQMLHLIENDTLYHAALDIAFRIRHPLHDCLYLAAAQSLGCPLITADETLAERGLKAHHQIQLLQRAA